MPQIRVRGPTKANVLLELKRWEKYGTTLQPIAPWDALCPRPNLECDQILDLKYLSISPKDRFRFGGGCVDMVSMSFHADFVQQQVTDSLRCYHVEKTASLGPAFVYLNCPAWMSSRDLVTIDMEFGG